MYLIQCAFDCIYQKDGYCELEDIAPVNSTKGGCPHYQTTKLSKGLYNKRKRLANTSNTNKLH